ncbi:frequency clock protein [Trichoderma barbatum]
MPMGNARQPADLIDFGYRPLDVPCPDRLLRKVGNSLAPPACSRCLLQADRGSALPNKCHETASLRRNSSGGSQSDAMEWFVQSNRKATANYNSALDADPPFFPEEYTAFNEDKSHPIQEDLQLELSTAHSSSADDYRSVIDDLTIEVQRLKGELKYYKQGHSHMLRKDKLFEIRMHGLPKRKKRELEAALQEFVATLRDSPETFHLKRKMSSQHDGRGHMYLGLASASLSKQASSSSGSNTRPVDSAYASMSTGANSSGTSLDRPQGNTRFNNDQKVENYIREIPKGSYPLCVAMTEKEKKKLVVRRLEQIFTGKMTGRRARRNRFSQAPSASFTTPSLARPTESSPQRSSMVQLSNEAPERVHEARILSQEHQFRIADRKNRSQTMSSAYNTNGDQAQSEGNGSSSEKGMKPSLTTPLFVEQRPTEPRDLDSDRVQIPPKNMKYFRHLGFVPPELILTTSARPNDDVRPDAEGWVYLNLLCNMAQLHMAKVTPDFIRKAVLGMSARFQLSPDGRKIRWRGGTDGTEFSSNSLGDGLQRSLEMEDTETKEERRKRPKTGRSTGESRKSDNKLSKSGPQVSAPSESFHYKPLFVYRNSSDEQSSMDEDTLSSFGPIKESNGGSRGVRSGLGALDSHERCRDGTIIYYSGLPFCTDLSGDPGNMSPALWSNQERADTPQQLVRTIPFRSKSGSSLLRRPLSETYLGLDSDSEMDVDAGDCTPELVTEASDKSSVLDLGFPWSDEKQFIEVPPLEPSGLSGLLPEDHFMVIVTTKRSKLDAQCGHQGRDQRTLSKEMTHTVINRLATMLTSSPHPFFGQASLQGSTPRIEIPYICDHVKRLQPVPLPLPIIFYPPLSANSWSEDNFGYDGDDELRSSEDSMRSEDFMGFEGFMSRRANVHQSDDYPDGVDLR